MDGRRAGLTARVAGPAAAAGAVSLGLVVIGACGLGHRDVYVAPPPINADLQVAPSVGRGSTTTAAVRIPPSPTWRIAAKTTPRATSASATATPSASGASGSSTRSTTSATRTPTGEFTLPSQADPFDDLDGGPTTTRRSRPDALSPPPTTLSLPAPPRIPSETTQIVPGDYPADQG
ncbi:hypothetical protein [Nocardia terpenica]|uniref:Uncharacterized protein n=2 Tax=Nocardia terpenica TaxID=455432 RepID=A0A164KKM9_9NOCA|nr:hypothetical protein [Nocardia terpenica]KZM71490.1 hypothetical protein AWN90_01700 [Nocardia terpenica]NQE90673.1 hypothetical protein [Nocardia terpenica]